MKKRLLICISSHGFGHFAMTAPIINQVLREDNFEIILRTTVPDFLIKSRLNTAVAVINEASDFGMQMKSSLDVELGKSLARYRGFHRHWVANVKQEAAKLAEIKPDLILANIPYVTLAAAQQLGIKSLAYCSLNWAGIVTNYFSDQADFVDQYIPQMLAAYNSAQAFICPAPSMAMPALHNVVKVAPVCSVGQSQRAKILTKLNLAPSSKLVLISAGGVATPIPVDTWPVAKDVIWLCAWSIKSQRKDIVSIDDIGIAFSDLMASVDAVITKPGYGTVSESVCHAVPGLFVRRGDWAEEPYLIEWWQQNGVTQEISRQQFFAGNFVAVLSELWQSPIKKPLAPAGVGQAVDIINHYSG